MKHDSYPLHIASHKYTISFIQVLHFKGALIWPVTINIYFGTMQGSGLLNDYLDLIRQKKVMVLGSRWYHNQEVFLSLGKLESLKTSALFFHIFGTHTVSGGEESFLQ